MRKINISQVAEAAQHSPKGSFAVFRKHISLALGGLKDVGVFGGGHPFDLELVRVPPGRAAWPLHSHSAQWELYVIVSGNGEVRTLSESISVGIGDVFIHPPEEAHQLRNIGSDDLVYYVIAEMRSPMSPIIPTAASGSRSRSARVFGCLRQIIMMVKSKPMPNTALEPTATVLGFPCTLTKSARVKIIAALI